MYTYVFAICLNINSSFCSLCMSDRLTLLPINFYVNIILTNILVYRKRFKQKGQMPKQCRQFQVF